MTDWIDFLVYAALMVAFWFVLPTTNSRLTRPMLFDRNPDWFAAHPEVTNRLADSRWFIRSCYVYGSLGLAVLLSFQLGAWPQALTPSVPDTRRWEVLKDINAAVMILGLAYYFGCVALFSRWARKHVPVAERRQASLEPRSIDAFVPRWLRLLAYALAGLTLGAWLTVGLLHRYSTPIFWTRLALLGGLSAFFIVMTGVAINRRPNAMDRIFGPAYRRSELRFTFAMQFLPPMIGAVRLYEEVTATRLVDVNRAGHLGIALFVAFGLLRFALFSQPRRDPGKAQPHSGASSAAFFIAVAVTLLAPVIARAQAAAPTVPPDARIRQILAERVDVHRQSVGIVVGVIEPAGRRVVAYGQRANGTAAPVDANSIFELGSITKVFTSLLLADAVRRGDVALSDPVAKYLPPNVRMPERNGRSITLQDLATHTSGLPREPANLRPKDPSNPFADYSVEQLYQFLSGYELTRDAGLEFEYSNLGAGLLGHVLARRAGIDYEALVRSRITTPLGMKDTDITLSSGMRARLAVGHNLVLEPVPNWDSPTLAGAGALRSSANDMLTFLAAALGYGTSPLQSAFAAMTATRRPTASPAVDVGLGWAILKEKGTEIFWSNGRTGGYRTWVGYEPRSRTGVIVLTNADGAVEPDDIGRHLLNPMFPLRQTFPPRPRQRLETKVSPTIFDRYVGRYQFAPSVMLTVTRNGSRFFGELTGQPPFELFAETEKDYFVKAVDAQFTFETDGQNKATAVVLHQNGVDQRAARID